ncbi:Ydr279p protein family (RNase H2 complex component) [Ceratobasidium sp. AG-Ba]|nr:Ydr279p protein family (RNase H2 complex component) [Ceratobasidium sp. AG-Ba]QRW08068.1 Ydr279p protein family (RNase H2 complex component) [Ceratobasidium sp. AG-Ba]
MRHAPDIPPDITVQRPSADQITSFLKRRVDRVAAAQEPSPDSTGPTFPAVHRQHLRLGLSVDELGPDTDEGAKSIRAGARIKIACEIIGTWVEESLMAEVLKTYDITAYSEYAEARAAQARAELALATAKAEAQEFKKGPKGEGSGTKRKAGGQGTRGVDKLKKANTKGMASLTTFFVKKQ